MTTYAISVSCCDSTWFNKNIIPYTFPGFFFKPQRLKYQFVAFLVHDVMKTFSCTFSNHNRLKYQFFGFNVHDVIKTLTHTFSLYFFKPQRLKYQLLAFLVHYVINHFPVPFETTTFEILVTCFSSTWRNENIFLYFLKPQPFEISVSWFSSTWCNWTFSRTLFRYFFKSKRLKYQLLAFIVHGILKYFMYFFFLVLFQTTTFEILVTCFSSSWRYQTFSRTFSNDNVWNVSYLLW